jgi:hypothetical protein
MQGPELRPYLWAPPSSRPVHDAQHQPQMVCEPGSPTLMHLRDDASATQRAADASSLVLHALVASRTRKTAIGHGDAHAFPDRLRVSPERENIGQEGFNALVYRAFRPGSLRASPCGFVEAREPDPKRLPVAASGLPWIKRRGPRSPRGSCSVSLGEGRSASAKAPGLGFA